jgi:hypothetical protein
MVPRFFGGINTSDIGMFGVSTTSDYVRGPCPLRPPPLTTILYLFLFLNPRPSPSYCTCACVGACALLCVFVCEGMARQRFGNDPTVISLPGHFESRVYDAASSTSSLPASLSRTLPALPPRPADELSLYLRVYNCV